MRFWSRSPICCVSFTCTIFLLFYSFGPHLLKLFMIRTRLEVSYFGIVYAMESSGKKWIAD